ncbi:phospho-sugar mutase [Anaerococcus hydrogenalis]|uniref:Phosphoglucomutase n=1 Tax=Anaerococcus hydrogenalis TaxID=33029 RepID=A0A2N6UKZ2_9FIRM|nr:phospho-sugar mutase [Anaerococcus hydrogenalis]MDK7694471.1 phospho-sugar mutase [Anaerococcus hydrogenalis]MDK7696249.1 phospho-sugar mutase [Anaerococcus hydrogenalis]MDK7707498.1 phospho-sugar mutase [Anaerococcus hydrogenalis]PMC82511.1 phosphoglucomutase [Anaerococcus hydrogenalis]
MDYKKIYEDWLNNEFFDNDTRNELKKIEDDEAEIEDRFYQELAFGTAGLRGKIGAGTNRMNQYTVAKATQGFADTINEMGEEAKEKGVVICYDVRHRSDEFSKISSEVFAANGIKVHIFKDIQPTPVCSYAIRKLKAIGGVMVTASHNPREYNGYKAYGSDGSQILEDTAVKIQNYMKEYDDYSKIKRVDFDKAMGEGIISYIDDSLIEEYVKEVLACTINEDIDKDVKIVYTPLNGCGNKLVRRILDERGFKNIYIVEEQENPDPDFSTVGYPNPEDPKAFKLSEELGKKVDAELLLATDPDSDRCAVEVKDENGNYIFLTGNQIGSLLSNYILTALKENNSLPKDGAIVKSIVSTDLVKPIAKSFGVDVYEVLTGFKNIYEVANEFEKVGKGEFIFGFEESIGYNYKAFVRDKDAVNAAMLISEMTAYYKKKGESLLEVLEKIYEDYEYYSNEVQSIVLEGLDGAQKIKRIMESIRKNPIDQFIGLKVKKIVDYQFDDTGLSKSNVLKYYLEDDSWFVLRPSGTEPKIKLYLNLIGESEEKAEDKKEKLKAEVNKIIDKID